MNTKLSDALRQLAQESTVDKTAANKQEARLHGKRAYFGLSRLKAQLSKRGRHDS